MMLPQTLYTLISHHPIACKAMLDVVPTPCYVRDSRGQRVIANQACEAALGWPANHIDQETLVPSLPAEVQRQLEEDDVRALAGATCKESLVQLPDAASGEMRTLRLYRQPVLDEQGRPAFVVVLAWSAEQGTYAPVQAPASPPQRQEDGWFQTLIEWAPDAVLVLRHGKIVYANAAAVVMVGAESPQTLAGRDFIDLFESPEREQQSARMRALDAGELVTPKCEARCVSADGNSLDVEIQATRIPLAGEQATHVVLRDISDRIAARTQRRADEQTLRDSALHTQTILDNMVDGVITISAQGLVESFNFAASRIFDYPIHEVLGRNVSMLMPEPYRSHHDGYLQHYMQTGQARVIGQPREVQGRRRDGSHFPMSLSVSKVDRAGQPTFVGLVRDETDRKAYEEEIRLLAFYDPLTRLPNRRLLLDRLQHALAQFERSRHFGALMFLDLDHFKRLNDTMGHDLGDILLQQVAKRLLDCVREVDSVARFGGDEFVVLLEGLGDNARDAATHAEMVANKVLLRLGQPYQLRDYLYNSTPSLGIVIFGAGDHSVDDLLKKADVAMYQAKAAGRNTSRFFDPSMQASVSAHAALEKDIREGLANGNFLLHYQVQVDSSEAITGVEALVRWMHPERGIVSPGEFIALAEETGLILPLGQWVMEEACRQLVAWADDPQKCAWTMAVNVSALQFGQDNFVAQVHQALTKTGARADLLKLEITESMLMSDVEAIIVKMGAIKATGVRMSLDDFGTGYSSLSYLKRLPLDQLKIDQSFVRDLLTDPNDAVIARTVVALGHSLGLKVIAEGVETVEQRDLLQTMGCDAFQGYLFGRPIPHCDLANVIASRKD
jgi:diguanylate cyclase (GGDEF)-like protein/PAS domain S-box-containing protein